MLDTGAEFLELIRGEDGAPDLARAAFAIALDDHPDLDLGVQLARLDALAARVRDVAGSDAPPALLAALLQVLFVEQGFAGNAADYYDPRNSYLHQVLDRRQGIPISLSVLAIEVARRAGVVLEPVGFPSHFLVSWGEGDGRRFLDPFRGGRSHTPAQLLEQLARLVGRERAPALFAQAVAAVPRHEVVARMLRNLKLIHAGARQWERALPVCHRLVALEDEAGSERRDRAQVLEHLDAHHAAMADYEAYLQHQPQAQDAAAVEARLQALRAKAGRLN